MVKEFDVIGLGTLAVDQIARIRSGPYSPHQWTCLPQDYELVPAGLMGKILRILAHLGLKTGYLGKIGGDRFGIIIKQAFADAGIDLSHCDILPSGQTSWNWVLLDDSGIRREMVFPNVLAELDENYIMNRAYYVKACQVLHIELTTFPLAPCVMAAGLAKASGVTVILTLNRPGTELVRVLELGTKGELEELIAFSDLFLLSPEQASELCDESSSLTMAKALQEKYLIPAIVVADERQGCAVATEEEETFQTPAFSHEIAQNSGYFEAFNAGITFGVMKEWDIRKTVRFALACGALTSRQDSGEAPFPLPPSETAIMQFLQQQEERIS